MKKNHKADEIADIKQQLNAITEILRTFTLDISSRFDEQKKEILQIMTNQDDQRKELLNLLDKQREELVERISKTATINSDISSSTISKRNLNSDHNSQSSKASSLYEQNLFSINTLLRKDIEDKWNTDSKYVAENLENLNVSHHIGSMHNQKYQKQLESLRNLGLLLDPTNGKFPTREDYDKMFQCCEDLRRKATNRNRNRQPRTKRRLQDDINEDGNEIINNKDEEEEEQEEEEAESNEEDSNDKKSNGSSSNGGTQLKRALNELFTHILIYTKFIVFPANSQNETKDKSIKDKIKTLNNLKKNQIAAKVRKYFFGDNNNYNLHQSAIGNNSTEDKLNYGGFVLISETDILSLLETKLMNQYSNNHRKNNSFKNDNDTKQVVTKKMKRILDHSSTEIINKRIPQISDRSSSSTEIKEKSIPQVSTAGSSIFPTKSGLLTGQKSNKGLNLATSKMSSSILNSSETTTSLPSVLSFLSKSSINKSEIGAI